MKIISDKAEDCALNATRLALALVSWLGFFVSKGRVASIWSAVFLACVSALAGEAKLEGLQFSLGLPADKPAARVRIAEIGQKPQKKGLLRIAVLPMAFAKGVEVRFERPELGALAEIPVTLKELLKVDVPEFQGLRFLFAGDPVPRLQASEVSLKGNMWVLRKVRLHENGKFRDMPECTLYLGGETPGLYDGRAGNEPVNLGVANVPR